MAVAFGGVLVQDGTVFFNSCILRWGTARVRCFHDIWCENLSLRDLYPDLYTCSADQNALVH